MESVGPSRRHWRGKPDLDDFRRIGWLAISQRQTGRKLVPQPSQRVGQQHVGGRRIGHQAGHEPTWPGGLVPRDDSGHERVRSDRIRLEGARHHRVDDLILGGHVLAFLGFRSGLQPAIVRANSRA